jgi:serine/threonine protein kinase
MSVRGAIRGSRSSRRRGGTTFAGVRIERELGRGGMGTVYLARELELDRDVALKVIREDFADDEEFRERFRAESRTAASIDHPRVVSVFGTGERDGLLYVAMRYVPGPDLQRLLASRGHLAPERAADLIAQVGEGLDAVHAAGLVHRDVKPANVIVSERASRAADAAAFLTDFGLARSVAATTGLTATGQLIGSVDYMAPEQIEGRRVDARTDVYALGCVLFQTLTGKVPFPEPETSAKLWSHLNAAPPSARSHSRAAAALDPVIARAMAKDPAERYPSAGDLGRAAVAAARGEAVTEPEHVVGAGEAAPDPETLPLATLDGDSVTVPLHRTPTTAPQPRRRRARRKRRWRRRIAILTLLVLAGLGAAAAVEVPRLRDNNGAGPAHRAAPAGVVVPNVVGEPLDIAEQDLHDAGFETRRIGDTGLFGVLDPSNWDVCDSAPSPGARARRGSTISLLIDRPDFC